MLVEKAIEKWDKKYDLNCAECIMYAANEEYNLNLSKETLKVMSSFGGGLAIGNVCGAITGAAGIIGVMFTEERGHQSPKTRELTSEFMKKFYDKLGDYNCTELKAKYRKDDDRRCIVMIETAAEILGEIIKREKNI